MTEFEYKEIQKDLSKKILTNPYKRVGNNKYAEGYEQGILAAKSILSSAYHKKE